MSTVKTTLVLGASPNPERVSYQALISLKKRAIPFIAVGKREYEDEVFKIIKESPFTWDLPTRKNTTIT
jgi:predicted CoA-binding protein